MKPRFHTVHAFPLAAALLTSSFVRAGQIWDGTGGDNNWNTAANWDGDLLPIFTNAITFVGNTRNGAVNNLTAASIIGGINLTNDGTTGKTNAFTLSGNSITLGGDITTTASSTAITDTISLAMILDGNRAITTNTNHNLIIGGIISETGGPRNLTKNGAGTLRFDSINTYSGTTTINAGTVEVRAGIAGGGAVWGSGPITLSQGALLFLNPGDGAGSAQALQNSVGHSISGAITLSGGPGTASFRFAGNDNKFVLSGGITGQAGVSQNLALIQGGTLGNGDRQNILVSGAIADGSGGTLGVSIDFANASGQGQRAFVNLTGQNTFSGDLTITNSKGLNGTGTHPGAWVTIGGERYDGFSVPGAVNPGSGYLGTGADYSGNISISNGNGGLTTLGFLTSANQILRGVISGTGSLHNQGSGTLTLTNANTFSGNTTIGGSGAIIMGHALALQNSPLITTSGTNKLTLFGTPSSLQLGGLSGASGSLGTIITSSAYNSISALTLNPQSGVSVTYGGALVNGASGMTLTKSGAGTQILSGANTYSGGTTISNGMLHFTRLVAQPASGAVAVGTGGTLAVNVGGTGEWTTGTSGNGTIGGLLGGLGGQSGSTVTYSGNVTLGFDTTNGVATQTYSGAIANVGTTLGINKLGTNILILSGDNTYGGATTVNGGRLVLTGTNSYAGGSFINGGMLQFGKLTAQPASGAVAVGTGATLAVNLGGAGEWTTGTSGNGTIGGLLAGLGGQSGGTVNYTGNVALGFDTSNATGSQTYANAIANVGTTLGITKLGTGTFTLSGVNTYTGATTVNGGTLLLDKTGTGGTAALASTSALVLGGGNFQMSGKTTGTTTQTLGALTLTANTNNSITLDSNGGTGTTLTLANSGPNRGVGSSLLIDRTIANTTLSSTLGLTAAAQTTTQGIHGYALVKDATGIGFAANVGGSIVRYIGADTTFAAASNSSTTNFKTTPAGTSTTGSPYLSGSVANPSFNSLHIDTASATGANFLSINGTVTLTQRALLMTGNRDFTIQGGTQLGAGNSEVIIHQTGSGNLTISSRISSGSGSLTKDGTGTLTITNSGNNYTGSTTLNAGTLQYASKTAFGTSTLHLSGGAKLQKITEEANIVGNAMANNIILTGGQVEMNVDFSTAKDQWFTGAISGLGGLRVTGSGAFSRQLALSGNNTFVGGVTLDTSTASSAWILLANANGLGTGTLTINHTGGAANQGLGANTNLTPGSGIANNIVINPGATFNLGGPSATGNVLLSGTISGAGALNKSDVAATTFTLSGTNTYNGSTTVSTGILQLGNGGTTGALTGTSGITNNANLTINRSNAFTQATDLNNKAIGGSGSFTQAGGGTTTLSLVNGYSGATTVSNGTLIVNGSISTSVLTTVQTGATLKGQGTVGALTVNGGGTLASGTSIESLATGNLTLLADAIFEQEIDDAFAGGNTSGDLTAVTGTLNLALTHDSVLNLLEVGSSGLWNAGDKLTLISYTGAWNGGLFEYLGNVLNDDSTFIFSGVTWEFDYNDSAPGDNFIADLTSPNYVTMTVVPEPRAALLGGLGLLMLLRRRRS